MTTFTAAAFHPSEDIYPRRVVFPSNGIYGTQLNDKLTAAMSGGSVFGNGGDDTVFGGVARDFLDGGDGTDLLSYADSTLGVEVSLEASTGSGGYAEGDAIYGFQDLTGSAFADSLTGGIGPNAITGGTGNDTLRGSLGADTLDGGGGADLLDGGEGADVVRYDASAAPVVVRLDIGICVGGDADGDVVSNTEGVIGSAAGGDFLFGDAGPNALHGLSGEDWLYGLAGRDELFGGADRDQLFGGPGSDTLTGGTGNDVFWFGASEFAAGIWDYVLDFDEGGANGFDYLRFEGVSASGVTVRQEVGFVVVSTAALDFQGGIVVRGILAADLLDQIIA